FIGHSRRHAIPLVVITGQAGSTLDQAADAALVLPPVEEACPLGMAPTTSTTLAMALGDALAVALLEQRGFTAEDYVALHPRGQLSGRLLRVEQIMHRGESLPLVASGTTMGAAILIMAEKAFGCVGVMADGRLAGIITDGDLRRHMDAGLLARPVDEVMTREPLNLTPLDLAVAALKAMNERPCFVAFVVEEDVPVGILHMHDCLRAGIL
ncbi:MAG: CBS domain-containing protein, partial [Alphaproteobacteria bacterium]